MRVPALKPSRSNLFPRAWPRALAVLLALTGSLLSARADDATPPAAATAGLAQVVRPVVAPGARAVAVHDGLDLLVIGTADEKGARLLVFRLRSGDIGEQTPVVVELPKAAPLGEFRHYPPALTFHPKLPVLYVWQDAAVPEVKDAAKRDPAADAKRMSEHFDHLLIYRVADGKLTPAGAHCRGADFPHGQPVGSLAVSGDARRLFIPNLRGPEHEDPRTYGALGYFDLDEQGAPLPIPVAIPGTLDGHGHNQFDMQVRPTWTYTGSHRYRWVGPLPNGTGFVAPTARFLIFGTHQGIGIWDTQDRGQSLTEIAVPRQGASGVGGHPVLPVIYAAGTTASQGQLMRVEHIDGLPAMMPQTLVVPGAQFRSPPVVFQGKQHGVAISNGQDQLTLIGLDKEGRFTDAIQSIPARAGGRPLAIAYSLKHDRLFVAVDEAAGEKK